MSDLLLSDKYKAFVGHVLRGDSAVDVLEGTTAAGKTTVGMFAFISRIYHNISVKPSIIAGLDTGTVEKNIISTDLGVLGIFGANNPDDAIVEYFGNGTSQIKIPHLIVHARYGDKIVYVFGYAHKDKWKKNLGAQYDSIYVDEANIADIEFLHETVMRCDYCMMTLNPDDPALPLYKEYINCCRPLPQYEKDEPAQIMEDLERVKAKDGYVHWFFRFEDNLGLTQEKKSAIIRNTPMGTKQYKNKILGLRGRSTGLVFGMFDEKCHILKTDAALALKRYPAEKSQDEWFVQFTAGLDTSYSNKSPDTIAMTFAGITNRGLYVLLDTKKYNNRDLGIPVAPSDTVRNYINFLDRNAATWGTARQVYIDSADQATIKEFEKYKRSCPGCIYVFNGAYKKITNVDRIRMQQGWMNCSDTEDPCFMILESCTEYIEELNLYSWDESYDCQPEDGHDHFIQSAQYGWIPYQALIHRKG